MTSNDSNSGSSAARVTPATDKSREAGDGFIERMLVRLGLKNPASIRDDLEDALSEGGETDDFSPQERTMLKNVLDLRGHRVDDVMVPRADIVAVPIDSTLGDLLRVFRTAGHSRLPVYAETLDDPRGMVHIRDFLDYMASRAESTPGKRRRKVPVDAPDLGKVDLTMSLSGAKILRPVLFVPPSMPALDLLVKMQTLRTHMALVIDEYGGTDGLVSMEDLVEIVLGNIEDEHDEDETPGIARAADGSVLIDARADLQAVSIALGVDLETGESAEDVDTIGGLIATIAGRLPVRGEIISHPSGVEFEVMEADPRRIRRVRAHLPSIAGAAEVPALPAPAKALPAPDPGPGSKAATTPAGAGPDDKPDRLVPRKPLSAPDGADRQPHAGESGSGE